MSKTVEVQLYTIDELDDEARDKALEEHRYINVTHDFWYEHIIDRHTEDLRREGMDSPEIYFSGLFSQGGGACIVGQLNLNEWTKGETIGYARIRKRRDQIGTLYNHENSVSVDVRDPNDKAMARRVLNWQKGKARKIAEQLRDEYLHQTKDEAVAETLKAMDASFREDGRRFD